MEIKSIRERIEIVESLSVDDMVKFEDSEKTEYRGEVTKIYQSERHKKYVIELNNNGETCVLKLLYDPEGGPVNVDIVFRDNSSNELISIEFDN